MTVYAKARSTSRLAGGRLRPRLIDMADFRIDNDLFRSVPMDLVLRYLFVPERQLDGRLSIVVADPTEVTRIDELELLLGQPVDAKVGVRSAIEEIS